MEGHRTRVPTGHKTLAQVALSPMAISLCVSRRGLLVTRKIDTKNNNEDAHRNREKQTKTTVTGSPANTANEIITTPEIVRPVLSVAELGISKMNAEAT